MSKLYFIRHAQASYLAKNYDQLSEKGEAQSLELGQYLLDKKLQFDKVFVGPLSRQQHTCEIVQNLYTQNKQAFPDPQMIPELREHSGPEGVKIALPELLKQSSQVQQWAAEIKTNPALRKRNNLLIFQYFMDHWSQGRLHTPGIQSWEAFRSETRKGLQQLLNETGKGDTVAVFTSGGTIASITAEALKITDESRVAAMNFSIRNTSFSTFLYSRAQFNLLSFNEMPHLQEEMITFV